MTLANVPGPYEPHEMERFLETFFYTRAGFFVDEVLRLDREAREIEAVLHTSRPLPLADLQRVDAEHPAHVAGPELVMATGSLGAMHAWFFHGCRWDEGWVGFGNRIHRADFKNLARRGPELRMHSRETRSRVGEQRVLLRYEFHFHQEDRLVYFGDQTAMFIKERGLGRERGLGKERGLGEPEE